MATTHAAPSPAKTPESKKKVKTLNGARIKRAQKALEKQPSLRPMYKKLLGLVNDATMKDAQLKRKIGAVVDAVRKDKKKYGKESVQTLADLLGFDKSTLYDYADVAKTWTAVEFNAVLKRENGLKMPVTFSHLILLSGRISEKERNEKLARVLDESLTVQQLRIMMKGPEVDAGAADPDADSDEPAELRDVRRMASAWGSQIDVLKRDTAWVIQRAEQNPAAGVLEELLGCADKHRALAKQAQENAVALETAHAALGKNKAKRA